MEQNYNQLSQKPGQARTSETRTQGIQYQEKLALALTESGIGIDFDQNQVADIGIGIDQNQVLGVLNRLTLTI